MSVSVECGIEDVLSFWLLGDARSLMSSRWFTSGAQQTLLDELIELKYGHLLEKALHNELADWRASISGRRALIIVLDQFSRHVYRRRSLAESDPLRVTADSLALIETQALITQDHWDDGLSVAAFVFAVMPMRHSGDIGQYETLMHAISNRETILSNEASLLDRFRRQTVRRMQQLSDRAEAAQADSILERAPFSADESHMGEEPLVQTIRRFLRDRSYGSPAAPAFLSLSGGVDSMVISKILAHLRQEGLVSDVLAVHIDYCNRDESAQEAAYVNLWCRSLDISCTVRVINEVRRGVTSREEYEKVARELRYASYRAVLSAHGGLDRGMIFGHHVGDLQENVVSNVMRGASPLTLAGMTDSSTAHGVTVWRPLLTHCKDDIFAFAHKYGVPYFRDTTPSWSTRGKLRTRLLPLLREMYGAGVTRNLSALAQASENTRKLLDISVFEPFNRAVERFPGGLSVSVRSFVSQPECFWTDALKELMHSMGMPLIREKSVANFIDLLQRGAGDSRLIWVELRRGVFSALQDGRLTVFREGVLAGEAGEESEVGLADVLRSPGQRVEVRICGWTIEISSLETACEAAEYCLPPDATRAVVEGSFSYIVRLCPGVTSLCLERSGRTAEHICLSGKMKKRSPSDARLKVPFRGLDTRLRSALPLLVEARATTEGQIDGGMGPFITLSYRLNKI